MNTLQAFAIVIWFVLRLALFGVFVTGLVTIIKKLKIDDKVKELLLFMDDDTEFQLVQQEKEVEAWEDEFYG